ncbi:two-component system response regulator [Salidesulfovibrio brasiliensis]|uniref:two-component system response regulator n=1 Tax=Salidesulfovibrio brasiliensis TaxID=221711 RepID=UPI0006CFD58C|nr:EAL domain-containing protein [Salidesulfovibrio brasiliensis]
MHSQTDILLVDDEPINIKLLKGILKQFDLNFITASSGEEALRVSAGRDFALILLDVMMPGMDGFECAERLREKPETRNTPIIFVTAINKEQDHIFRGYELGAVDYLFKPVEPEVLRSKVRTFVELQVQRKSLQKAADKLGQVVRKLQDSREALEESERRYRIVADYNYDWESWFGPEGDMLYVSPASERISGYSRERFMNDPRLMESIIHPDDLPLWREFLVADSGDDDETIDFRIYNSSARIRWVNAVKRKVVEDDKWLGNRVSLRDVTERKELKERMHHLSLHDPMTGLPNRSLCMERVSRAQRRSRHLGKYFGVILLDLDRFKVVNESLGHVAGDKLLSEVASRLLGLVGDLDSVGRFGGDEFVLLLEEIDSPDVVESVANKVVAALRQPFLIGGEEIRLSASLGVVISDGTTEESSEDILHSAHIAMYKSKEGGKDQYQTFADTMKEQAVRMLTLEKDLRRALREEQFLLHFQPLVNLRDRVVSGFEVLVRWQHPGRGLVSPGEFIPIAEESGIIVEMGEWILRKACTTFKKWMNGCPNDNDFFLSVNISARQFRESSLVPMVAETIASTGISPRRLKLEITETVVMLDVMDSIKKLRALKDLGIMLSIDDFGTGYSSMSYLQKFPLDQLKVDLSFVQRLDRDPDSIEIVRAIINLAHALRLSVVAEGIETPAQRDLLNSLQCDYGQGYLFARPLPEGEAHDIFAEPTCLKATP